MRVCFNSFNPALLYLQPCLLKALRCCRASRAARRKREPMEGHNGVRTWRISVASQLEGKNLQGLCILMYLVSSHERVIRNKVEHAFMREAWNNPQFVYCTLWHGAAPNVADHCKRPGLKQSIASGHDLIRWHCLSLIQSKADMMCSTPNKISANQLWKPSQLFKLLIMLKNRDRWQWLTSKWDIYEIMMMIMTYNDSMIMMIEHWAVLSPWLFCSQLHALLAALGTTEKLRNIDLFISAHWHAQNAQRNLCTNI